MPPQHAITLVFTNRRDETINNVTVQAAEGNVRRAPRPRGAFALLAERVVQADVIVQPFDAAPEIPAGMTHEGKLNVAVREREGELRLTVRQDNACPRARCILPDTLSRSISSDRGSFPARLVLPPGELLHAKQISVADFERTQSKRPPRRARRG